MSVSISPNMNLIIPGVGTEPGPTWASDLNASLTLIDQHNHSPGFGVQIGTDGLNITSDLTFNSTNLLAIRAARFTPQNAILTLPADLAELYVVSNDLFYNDGTGAPIRITQNGSIVGTSGSISGLVPPASVSYAGGTFTFQSNVNTPANIDGASFILRNFTANSKGLTLEPPNAMASNYTITLPSLPSNPAVLTIDSSGNITASTAVFASSQPTTSALGNVGLLATVAANALTVALKQADGTTDPTADSPDLISYRSAVATTGAYVVRLITSAVSVIVPNGATLGLTGGFNRYIFIYAIDNSGTTELAVSGSKSFDESTLQNTTAISGSSTNSSVLYSTSARTNVPVRLIGRIGVNEAVAGVYATAPFEVSVSPLNDVNSYSSVFVEGGANNGTVIRSYVSVTNSVGAGITYASSGSGDTFTINDPGMYSVEISDVTTTNALFGVTQNCLTLTSSIATMTYANGRRSVVRNPFFSGTNEAFGTSTHIRCSVGDVIRVQMSSIDAGFAGASTQVYCHVQKIGN